jgi:hypothetical protein
VTAIMGVGTLFSTHPISFCKITFEEDVSVEPLGLWLETKVGLYLPPPGALCGSLAVKQHKLEEVQPTF